MAILNIKFADTGSNCISLFRNANAFVSNVQHGIFLVALTLKESLLILYQHTLFPLTV